MSDLRQLERDHQRHLAEHAFAHRLFEQALAKTQVTGPEYEASEWLNWLYVLSNDLFDEVCRGYKALADAIEEGR